MSGRCLPSNASVAQAREGDKMHAPAAERNAEAIADLVARFAPETGDALEIASGTGQHVVRLAKALPGLTWQPSEVAEDRLRSIAAYRAEADVGTILPPVHLNALEPGWGAGHAADLILLVNLTHLVSAEEVKTFLNEVAIALRPGGTLILYGPFMRDGELISDGDRAFHAGLVQSDPAIGYKNDADVEAWMRAAGLTLADRVEMPANNLAIIARRH